MEDPSTPQSREPKEEPAWYVQILRIYPSKYFSDQSFSAVLAIRRDKTILVLDVDTLVIEFRVNSPVTWTFLSSGEPARLVSNGEGRQMPEKLTRGFHKL